VDEEEEEQLEALYEEISEPIYEEVKTEYEACLKRCLMGEVDDESNNMKSMFDGASRDEILTYLEGAQNRSLNSNSSDQDSGCSCSSASVAPNDDLSLLSDFIFNNVSP
jgi:hypothetical protein